MAARIAVPNVPALVDILKEAQMVEGKRYVTFAMPNSEKFPPSAMGAPGMLKSVKVGWDGAMFEVHEGRQVSFHDDRQIESVLPIGKAAFVPMAMM